MQPPTPRPTRPRLSRRPRASAGPIAVLLALVGSSAVARGAFEPPARRDGVPVEARTGGEPRAASNDGVVERAARPRQAAPQGPLLEPGRTARATRLPEGPAARELAIEVLAAAPPPVGLSAGRRAERAGVRSERLAAVAAMLEGRAGRARANQLEAWLLDPGTEPELWAAAVDLVGALDLERFATAIDWTLDEPTVSWRRCAARRALHDLFGLWFESGAGFAPFAEARARPLRRFYRDRLLDLEQRELELRRRAWVEPEPMLADLADPSPRVRAGAATALVAWLAERPLPNTERATELAAPVLARLAVEPDAQALDALLQVAQELVRDLAPDAPTVRELRGLLAEALAGAPIRCLPSVARALTALPLDPERAATWEAPARALIDALDRRARSEAPDADATVALVGALRRMASAVGGARLAAGVEEGAPTAAMLDLAGAPSSPDAVRRAALAALSDVALPGDLPAVVERSGAEALDEALRFELLGVVDRLAARLEQGDPSAERVGELAFESLSAPQPDLRRRALSLLERPAVRAAVADRAASRLLAAVVAETAPELRGAELALLRESGGPEELRVLLSVPDLVGDGGTAEALATVVPALAAGDARLGFDAARRIAERADRRARELALEIVFEVPVPAAGLDAGERASVVRWALDLLDAGTFDEVRDDPTDAARLRSEFLPGAEGLTDLERARAAGLLAHAAGEDPALVERELGVALTLAGETDPRRQLLRARARMRIEVGDPRGAFEDWRALAAAAGGVEALELEDLRGGLEAGELAAASLEADPERRALAAACAGFGAELLSREAWRLEPVALRWNEVERLGSVVGLARDRDTARRLLDWSTPLDPPPTNGDRRPLDDLLGRPELAERAATLRARLTALVEAEAADAPASEGEPRGDSSDEAGGDSAGGADGDSADGTRGGG